MDTLVGGRIQDVLAVDESGFGFEIYANRKRHYLYISVSSHTPRLHLVNDKLRRGLPQPTPLGLLLRRYVEGGTLVHLSQPSWERILHFDIEGPEGELTLVAEPMERRSNLLLLRGDTILDCARRIGPQENRFRVSLPNQRYIPPPPQAHKLNPFDLTEAALANIFAKNEDPKAKVASLLSNHLLGFSPLLAREVVYRAFGDVKQKADESADIATLFRTLREFIAPLRNRDWQPGIAEPQEGRVEAFSPYPLSHIAGWRRLTTMSEALVAFYGAAVGPDAYTEAKKPVFAGIQEGRARLKAKIASLERSLLDVDERDTLRQSGELILAYQYTLAPRQTELRAQYDPEGPELIIPLDPQLTPLENAQYYFERYEKAKRALEGVPELLKAAQEELAYVEQLAIDLELASNWPEIDDVQQALLAKGYLQGKVKRVGGGGRTGPLRIATKDGYIIWVGRNSRQNELATFKYANPNDFWLHARDVPGAHVIIRDDGRRISQQLLEQAAAVAAYYSAKRHENAVIVDITRRKYVRKIKSAGPGMVTYRNERTMTVKPQNEAIFEES